MGSLKYLVPIALVALLFVFLYRRLRPYLKLVREFLNTIRHFQQITTNRVRPPNQQPEKLVCCAQCGTWVPIGRALTAGSGNAVFCSDDCLSGKKRRTQDG
jgi:hypothetical protein